mgnify:CR=1 FL=1
MSDCLFCKMVAGEIKPDVVFVAPAQGFPSRRNISFL